MEVSIVKFLEEYIAAYVLTEYSVDYEIHLNENAASPDLAATCSKLPANKIVVRRIRYVAFDTDISDIRNIYIFHDQFERAVSRRLDNSRYSKDRPKFANLIMPDDA